MMTRLTAWIVGVLLVGLAALVGVEAYLDVRGAT